MLRLDYWTSSGDLRRICILLPIGSSTTFRLIAAGLLAITIGWFPARAGAQIFKVCGDVDDNDVVSVTDGVQVLRAAAELSSDCTAGDLRRRRERHDHRDRRRHDAPQGRRALDQRTTASPTTADIDQQIAYLLQFSEPLVSAVLPTISAASQRKHRQFLRVRQRRERHLRRHVFRTGSRTARSRTVFVDNADRRRRRRKTRNDDPFAVDRSRRRTQR